MGHKPQKRRHRRNKIGPEKGEERERETGAYTLAKMHVLTNPH